MALRITEQEKIGEFRSTSLKIATATCRQLVSAKWWHFADVMWQLTLHTPQKALRDAVGHGQPRWTGVIGQAGGVGIDLLKPACWVLGLSWANVKVFCQWEMTAVWETADICTAGVRVNTERYCRLLLRRTQKIRFWSTWRHQGSSVSLVTRLR